MSDFVDRTVALALGTAPLAHVAGGASVGVLDHSLEDAPLTSSAGAIDGVSAAVHAPWPADAETSAAVAPSAVTAGASTEPIPSGRPTRHARSLAARASEVRAPGTEVSDALAARPWPGVFASSELEAKAEAESNEATAEIRATTAAHEPRPPRPAVGDGRSTAPWPTAHEAEWGAEPPTNWSVTPRRERAPVEPGTPRRRMKSTVPASSSATELAHEATAKIAHEATAKIAYDATAKIAYDAIDAPGHCEPSGALPGSAAANPYQHRKARADVAPPIRVSIGRIEVHAPAPAPAPAPAIAAPPAAPPRTAISLESYLARRGGRR
ncbi:hypothetical protein [Haliangium sp.]|uniref:hypothetical protein n=1 Tax=Haliangium sp. TaxID=2663208 RepID=UPI003D09DFB5